MLSAETIERYGEEINAKVVALNTIHLPLEERSTDDKAFLQVTNIWTQSEVARKLVFSRRLAAPSRREPSKVVTGARRADFRRRCPRPESNQRTRFRKPLLYPLSYGGQAEQRVAAVLRCFPTATSTVSSS